MKVYIVETGENHEGIGWLEVHANEDKAKVRVEEIKNSGTLWSCDWVDYSEYEVIE